MLLPQDRAWSCQEVELLHQLGRRMGRHGRRGRRYEIWARLADLTRHSCLANRWGTRHGTRAMLCIVRYQPDVLLHSSYVQPNGSDHAVHAVWTSNMDRRTQREIYETLFEVASRCVNDTLYPVSVTCISVTSHAARPTPRPARESCQITVTNIYVWPLRFTYAMTYAFGEGG